MSYPDVEQLAAAIEAEHPTAAARLRQLARLAQTQEMTVTRLQTDLAVIQAAALAERTAATDERENLLERLANLERLENTWRELPEVKARLLAAAIQKRDEAAAEIVALGGGE